MCTETHRESDSWLSDNTLYLELRVTVGGSSGWPCGDIQVCFLNPETETPAVLNTGVYSKKQESIQGAFFPPLGKSVYIMFFDPPQREGL